MKSNHFFCISILLFIGGTKCYRIEDSNSKSMKIISGVDISLDQAPYHVSLQFDGRYHCGGALITFEHVLTAAHCVSAYAQSPSRFTVVAGTIYSDGYEGSEHAVKYVFSHPEFLAADIVQNDIAVLKLEKPFVPSSKISVIALPTVPISSPELSTVTGFGRYSLLHEYVSEQLKSLTTYAYSYETCRSMAEIEPNEICDYVQKGTGVCFGDSGSPLVNQRKEIVGVVSRGEECAAGIPTIYSSVYHQLPYIRTVLLIE